MENATQSVPFQQGLGKLDFNPNLKFGYRKRTDLEQDLLDAIELIKWSDHIIWIFPIWWIGGPAILKSFIDRTFLPHIFYEVGEDYATTGKLIGLLEGRTSHFIITADSTGETYKKVFYNSFIIQMEATLNLCGISNIKNTFGGPVVTSTEEERKKWIAEVAILARKQAVI